MIQKENLIPMTLLSFLSFFQVGMIGFYDPVLSVYFTDGLGFSGSQTGNLMALATVAGVVSPLLLATWGDRLMSPRKWHICLHVLAFAGGLLMLFSNSYFSVAVSYTGYAFVITPTLATTNVITFRALGQERDKYSSIRLWGTVGWMAAGWIFGSLFMRLVGADDPSHLKYAFLFSSVCSLVVISIIKLLPETDNPLETRKSAAWFELKKVLTPRLFFLLFIMFIISVIDRFYYLGFGPYLVSLGLLKADVAPLMTLGQASEIVALIILGGLVKKIGSRKVLVIGLGFLVLRYLFILISDSALTAVPALLTHGIIIGFVLFNSIIIIDSLIPDNTRQTVHQLMNCVFIGMGGFAGNLIAGRVFDLAQNNPSGFSVYWLIPLCAAFVVFLSSFALFGLVERSELKRKAVESCDYIKLNRNRL